MFHKPLRVWRAFLRLPYVIKLMIVIALIGLGVPAFAGERFAREGADEVRLFDSPCLYGGVLARIQPAVRARFQKAVGKFGGQTYFGCWTAEGDAAFVVWEDGDQGVIPNQELKEQPEA